MRNQHQVKEIIERYHQGKCTAEELEILKELLSNHTKQALLEDVYDELDEVTVDDALRAGKDQLLHRIVNDPRIAKQIGSKPNPNKIIPFRTWYWAAAAAVVLLLLVPSIYYMFGPDRSVTPDESAQLHSAITPGGDKAHILLEDGTIINLDQIQGDTVIYREGFSIVKSKDGEVYYQYDKQDKPIQQTVYNTIVTPKGGQYRIALPDGTQVSLNAESSLKYPVYFEEDERIVELVGEGYFDVAKSHRDGKSIPFIVHTGNQRLQVLGTEFNINSYDKYIKTTLIEGKVSLESLTDGHQPVILKPNQQSIFNDQQHAFEVHDVDPLYAMAWTKGNFAFQRASIHEVLESIARWYDVEVVFKGDFEDAYFTGTLSRFEDIHKLLRTIELTETIHFKIEGRRVLVLE